VSEDAKLRNLKDRILDAAKTERNGLQIILMSVFLVCSGLIISVVVNNVAAYIGGTLVMLFGFVSTLFGFYVSIHYAHQYNNLLEELDMNAER
jgi:Ni,Fe-hydrogenase I cytochrome b subunit